MESLLVVLAVLVLGGIGFLIYLQRRPVPSPAPPEFPPSLVEALADLKVLKDKLGAVDEIKTTLAVGSAGQADLKVGIEKTRDLLEHLRREQEKQVQHQEEDRERLRRLDTIVAGTYAKGATGENMLREVFKQFPKEMLVTNFRVRDRVVEFGLVLANGKKLPIDSKWTATDLLLQLEQESDQERRLQLIEQIDREIVKRVKEVTQYIDPAVTVPWAVAAIPDAAFSVCRRAHLEAHRLRVMLMSYSLAIPYILSFYGLHLQYSRSVDMENLQSHLAEITRLLDEMEQTLENRMVRSTTMLNNAADEYRQLISRIRGSIARLQLPPTERTPRPLPREQDALRLE